MNKTHTIIFFIFLLLIPAVATTSVAYYDGTYCPVYNISLNATVTDADNDLMDVGFFWGNYTSGNYVLLAAYFNVTSGSNLSVFLPDVWCRQINVNGYSYDITWLEHSHRYEWFIYGDDHKNASLKQNNFDTCNAWDLNVDKTINYLDISEMVAHYGQQVIPPGEKPWDINEDGHTDYLDISILVAHFGQTY